jgi:hypothetical protein
MTPDLDHLLEDAGVDIGRDGAPGKARHDGVRI